MERISKSYSSLFGVAALLGFGLSGWLGTFSVVLTGLILGGLLVVWGVTRKNKQPAPKPTYGVDGQVRDKTAQAKVVQEALVWGQSKEARDIAEAYANKPKSFIADLIQQEIRGEYYKPFGDVVSRVVADRFKKYKDVYRMEEIPLKDRRSMNELFKLAGKKQTELAKLKAKAWSEGKSTEDLVKDLESVTISQTTLNIKKIDYSQFLITPETKRLFDKGICTTIYQIKVPDGEDEKNTRIVLAPVCFASVIYHPLLDEDERVHKFLVDAIDRLVSNGWLDYGVLAPPSEFELALTEAGYQKCAFCFPFPSMKLLELKLTEDERIAHLNKLVGCNLFVKEGQLGNDYQHLYRSYRSKFQNASL